MAYGEWYPRYGYPPYATNSSSVTLSDWTWQDSTTYRIEIPPASQITITPPPEPDIQTEIDALLAEVESVCALAR